MRLARVAGLVAEKLPLPRAIFPGGTAHRRETVYHPPLALRLPCGGAGGMPTMRIAYIRYGIFKLSLNLALRHNLDVSSILP
jgi:hypothetical protein